MTLVTHLERNERVTGCLFCGKRYEQVIEEIVADYLHHMTHLGKSTGDQQLKRNAFVADLESKFFNYIARRVSRAATWYGLAYRVNIHSQNLDVEEYPLPLFEYQNNRNFE